MDEISRARVVTRSRLEIEHDAASQAGSFVHPQPEPNSKLETERRQRRYLRLEAEPLVKAG